MTRAVDERQAAATGTAGTGAPGAGADAAGVGPARAAPADPRPPAPGTTARERVGALGRRAYDAVAGEALIVSVLLGSFLARWLIADRNSYWLDELYSVAIYGIWNPSAGAAVEHLATTSVHPPVYQFLLYHWMELFGDGERATRSLSNLYITLATLFLYLLLRHAFGRRMALASAAAFALMYTATRYGLETRSYAQTIFLVTLSSYALLRLMRLGAARGWWRALLSPTAAVFTAANVALLLTHYYNAFFWVAQGIIAGVFVLRERAVRGWFTGLGAVAALYGLQGAIFALVWGDVLLADYRRRGGAFPVEGGVRSPLALLQSVVRPNLEPPRLLLWLGLAVALVLVARAMLTLARGGTRPDLTEARRRAWTVAYLVGWLVVPLVVVYVAFMVTGVARYSPRYWLFIVPPLAPLVILTIEEAAALASRAWQRFRGVALHPGWATLTAVAVIAALIVPGTLAAATRTKADWRGTAQDIVAIVESNPDSSYLVYETSFRSTPVLDYYLSEYSDEVRVAATIRRADERAGSGFSFERTADLVEQHDFLIVAFIHHRTRNFPIALAKLTEIYQLHHWQINQTGRGLVIFSVSPPDDPAPAAEQSS